ncbi:MAG: MBOAT family protein [Prevotella sp.]|nr:MBOAT family protein [Prevotella sp.]
MSFVSVAFFIFLPVVFTVYWLLGRNLRWQNLWLLLASYVFYGWWDWRFLILILITSVSSFVSGLWLEHAQHKRAVVASNIVLNLGILGVFKYYDFFVENLQKLFLQVGYSLDVPTLRLILPVGISFYTFQSLSYTIDVYRGKLRATNDVVAFFAYIAFFPQLVAGPIERASHLLPQILGSRTFRYDEATDGLRRMLWGFFKKMVVADNCAVAVNLIWENYAEADALTLIGGMLLFTFQIYGDFSGYSDIAIGTSKLFGINLMENFRLPYFSKNIGEFWRRWHISLMAWFRDYLYIPLGGSREGSIRTVRNVFIVFLLSGLWHGANWTFVAWGGYNACLLTVQRWLRSNQKSDLSDTPTWHSIPQIIFTFFLVAIGWVVFRSASIAEAFDYLTRLFTTLSSFSLGGLQHGKVALLYCGLMLVVEWMQRDRLCPLQLKGLAVGRYRVVRWTIYYLVLILVFFGRGEDQTFIYFQF